MPGVADVLGPNGPLRDAIVSRLDTIPCQQHQYEDPHKLEIGVGIEANGLPSSLGVKKKYPLTRH